MSFYFSEYTFGTASISVAMRLKPALKSVEYSGEVVGIIDEK